MKALSSAAGLAALGLLGSCVSGTEGNGGSGACNAFLDSDSDGLDDCTETILGTDPESPDSDGDGMTDAEEAACISNPLDAEELCYACGWVHGDPGDLVSNGAQEGDTVDNVALVDACEETVDLWDLAGEYHILFMTAEW